jgi:hypothetical protein
MKLKTEGEVMPVNTTIVLAAVLVSSAKMSRKKSALGSESLEKYTFISIAIFFTFNGCFYSRL